MGRLFGEIVRVPDLTGHAREAMFSLLAAHFDGVRREGFEQDLAEKEFVILLRDAAQGLLRGFSTVLLMRRTLEGRPVRALFSGDTIIHPDFWGEVELPRVWLRLVDAQNRLAPDQPLYWFLICMGYKTYRFLHAYMNQYYPCHQNPTPAWEQAVLDDLARAKFGDQYDPVTGVIRPAGPAARLRPGVADITPARLRNPVIRFYAERNPGHAQGHELACLSSLDDANLNRLARRIRDTDMAR